jgi:hypothetical protein
MNQKENKKEVQMSKQQNQWDSPMNPQLLEAIIIKGIHMKEKTIDMHQPEVGTRDLLEELNLE